MVPCHTAKPCPRRMKNRHFGVAIRRIASSRANIVHQNRANNSAIIIGSASNMYALITMLGITTRA